MWTIKWKGITMTTSIANALLASGEEHGPEGRHRSHLGYPRGNEAYRIYLHPRGGQPVVTGGRG